MSLKEELNLIRNEAFYKSFEDWFEKEDVIKTLKDSAEEGYVGHKFDIVNSDDRKKLDLLFSHSKFEEVLNKRLGDGFEIKYVKKKTPYEHPMLSVTMYKTENYLLVRWG
ncbi:hypothetical protein EVU91_04525 [Macrococcoides bohemicum]|uniref:hypothetical protein n=1 Tax=Macrococcoides bohemicum TaxID=1903056 RepID=UPI00105A662D|nr:hypothetical protein [Macrococcus bohemicus]TDL39414.1 hypothetical protein EVU91_04525 [Macrococcus bohemicus]